VSFIECFSFPTVHKNQNKNYFRLGPCPSNHLLALHILSISVIVEFVCLLVQLLLVTCVSSLFHLTLAVTPTVTPPPLGFPSLSRGAVGQKKEKKRRKKGKQSKKRRNKKKRERIRKKRETAAQSKWETGSSSSRYKSFAPSQFATDSSLLKVFSVDSGSVFAMAYRTSPGILHGKTTTPQHTHHIQSLALLLRERERIPLYFRKKLGLLITRIPLYFRKKCMW
jgi:hypothetical protein